MKSVTQMSVSFSFIWVEIHVKGCQPDFIFKKLCWVLKNWFGLIALKKFFDDIPNYPKHIQITCSLRIVVFVFFFLIFISSIEMRYSWKFIFILYSTSTKSNSSLGYFYLLVIHTHTSKEEKIYGNQSLSNFKNVDDVFSRKETARERRKWKSIQKYVAERK